MGFFKRIFRRRPKGDDHLLDANKSKKQHRNQKGRRGQGNPIDPPEQRDDGVDDSVVTFESNVERNVPVLSTNAQLSRITEEPTFMSSSTATDLHHTNMKHSPPPAREAAFHGPPRFDWMDIETTAATKIQSIYRRNKVMDTLEKKGYSTSAIRNRKRRRKASRGRLVASEDAPSIFSCCAIGLAFGDATEDDDAAYREFQKRQYEERVKQQQMHEDALRKQYLRSQGGGIKVVEKIEVVE